MSNMFESWEKKRQMKKRLKREARYGPVGEAGATGARGPQGPPGPCCGGEKRSVASSTNEDHRGPIALFKGDDSYIESRERVPRFKDDSYIAESESVLLRVETLLERDGSYIEELRDKVKMQEEMLLVADRHIEKLLRVHSRATHLVASELMRSSCAEDSIGAGEGEQYRSGLEFAIRAMAAAKSGD